MRAGMWGYVGVCACACSCVCMRVSTCVCVCVCVGTGVCVTPRTPVRRSRDSFMYDIDSTVLNAMSTGSMHTWTVVELKAICWKHGLPTGGLKAALGARVVAHFTALYV